MKAEELRTGNLIYRLDNVSEVDWATIKLCAQRNKQFNEDWKPIPLTPEWLERFGFKVIQNIWWGYGKNITCHFDSIGNLSLYLGVWGEDFIYIKSIQYAHELQNFCYVNTGEELTLKS